MSDSSLDLPLSTLPSVHNPSSDRMEEIPESQRVSTCAGVYGEAWIGFRNFDSISMAAKAVLHDVVLKYTSSILVITSSENVLSAWMTLPVDWQSSIRWMSVSTRSCRS
ncbi:uncharacterized protein RAG0_13606 [Rhynchosporium agropyri]|uniref:Uncharacterized protein n=1 Tax=Rhynchosporium agropyri TaxID=914238 RepID=A0A1E1LDQ1_9HELO|nr:uncharacterized protein RAG0_13606 [Rhynchosporium agropyri]